MSGNNILGDNLEDHPCVGLEDEPTQKALEYLRCVAVSLGNKSDLTNRFLGLTEAWIRKTGEVIDTLQYKISKQEEEAIEYRTRISELILEKALEELLDKCKSHGN